MGQALSLRKYKAATACHNWTWIYSQLSCPLPEGGPNRKHWKYTCHCDDVALNCQAKFYSIPIQQAPTTPSTWGKFLSQVPQLFGSSQNQHHQGHPSPSLQQRPRNSTARSFGMFCVTLHSRNAVLYARWSSWNLQTIGIHRELRQSLQLLATSNGSWRRNWPNGIKTDPGTLRSSGCKMSCLLGPAALGFVQLYPMGCQRSVVCSSYLLTRVMFGFHISVYLTL